MSDHESADRAHRSRHGPLTPRRLILGGAAAGATAVTAGLLVNHYVREDDADAPGAPTDAPRPTGPLEEEAPHEVSETGLGHAFVELALQDVLPLTLPGGGDGLLVTQSGSTRQAQVIDRRSLAATSSYDIPVGVNQGAAVDGDGTIWLPTRDGGSLFSIRVADGSVQDHGSPLEDVTSLYSLAVGADGRIWGGSYPSGCAWCFDPVSGEFTVGSRIGDNEYARSLCIVGDTILAGSAYSSGRLVRVDPATADPVEEWDVPDLGESGGVTRMTSLGDRHALVYRDTEDDGNIGIIFDVERARFGSDLTPTPSYRSVAWDATAQRGMFVVDGTVYALDPTTGTITSAGKIPIRLPEAVVVASGQVWAIESRPESGTKLDISALTGASGAAASATVDTQAITMEPSARDIRALVPVGRRLVVGGYQGRGISVFDLDSGQFSQSATESGIQQVEGGVQVAEDIVFLGSYGGAELFEVVVTELPVLDSSVTALGALGSDYGQDRPVAWTAGGQYAVVGTVPATGERRGAVAVLDTRRGGIEAVQDDAVGRRSVVGLAAVGDHVVATTSNLGAYGEPVADGPSLVVRLDPLTGELLWSTEVDEPALYSPMMFDDDVLVASPRSILRLDVETGEIGADIVLDDWPDEPAYYGANLIGGAGETLLHLGRGILRRIDLAERTYQQIATGVSRVVRVDDQVLVSRGTRLSRLGL